MQGKVYVLGWEDGEGWHLLQHNRGAHRIPGAGDLHLVRDGSWLRLRE